MKVLTLFLFDLESSAKVGEPLLTIELGLSAGDPDAFQGIVAAEAAQFSKFAAELESLISVPALLSSPVQGDGDKEG